MESKDLFSLVQRSAVRLVPSLAICLVAFANSEAAPNGAYDIEIVLDGSGSMAEALGGSNKMEAAKAAVKSIVDKLPQDARVGFRAYGHQSSRESKNCSDSALLVPVGQINRETFKAQVDSVRPNGYTPIEYALQEAKKDFPADAESGKMIILVSDGKETCGGDPCRAVKSLRDSGFKLEVNVVGFAVDAETAGQLKCIADASGGQYKDAANAAELVEGLERFTERARLEYKPTGGAITPGAGFSDAAPISPGEFTVDLLSGETHFFKLDAPAGQELSFVVNGTNKNAKKYVWCGHELTVNLYDSRKILRKQNSTRIDSDRTTPQSVVIEKVRSASPSTYYLTISNLRFGTSDRCETQRLFYELGVFVEPTAVVSSTELPPTAVE